MPTSPGPHIFTNYSDEAWQAGLFRSFLMALLAGSMAAGPAVVRLALGGSWTGYLIAVAVVVAAVAVGTTRLLGRPTWRDRRGAAFRVGELLLLLMAARILVWIFAEGFPSPATVRGWLLHPGSFLTGSYVFAVFVLLFVWMFAITITADFRELAIQADEVAARESHEWGDSRSQWRAGQPYTRTDLLQGFALRWIGIGIMLVICAGMTRVEVSLSQQGIVRLGLRGLGLRPEVVASLVCYFLSGLLLISQGRLAVLRGRWFNQDVEIPNTLIRRWHVYSLLFVGLIALAALLLPLGSTGWFVGAVEWVISLLIRIALFIGFLIGFVITMLMSLLARLFGTPDQPPPQEVPPPRVEVVPSQAEIASNLPPWLGGAVLWLVVVVVATVLLVNFLRTSGLLQSKFGAQILQWRLWWRARRARIGAVVKTGFNTARGRLRRVRKRVLRPQEPRPGREGPLLPREQVRRYYLAAVREAGKEGVARPAHETPLEYAEDLAEQWPETSGDVRELTDAFIDARYTRRDVGEPEVKGAESAWRRFVAGLRGDKKQAR